MTQTILLAGATGMLGGEIARQLLAQPDTRVRLLLRGAATSKKLERISDLLTLGAESVEGDLTDRDSLERATQGIDVIISAVQGGPDIIIDGQIALAEAGKRNGARRILPSDFALDVFKATPGEHAMFDMRREADDRIRSVGLETIHILQGAFMNMFLPGKGAFDDAAGKVSFWGDGSMPIETTSVDDTARMTARVALDRSLASGKFAFAGDRISFQQAAEVLEKQTGRRYRLESLGSISDLRAAHAAALADTSNPFRAVMLAYVLYMTTGQTALENLQSRRFADVSLKNFEQFVEESLPSKATGS